MDNPTSISGSSSNGESSHLSFHQNYDLIQCTTGITSPSTASVQSTEVAGQAKEGKGPGSAQRTVVAALAVSLGASASLAVVLLWLRWRRRSQMSPSDAARPSITASPDDFHHDSTEQGDSELCDAYSLPVVESGEDNHSNEIRRRVRNGQVGHGIQSADRTSTFTCGSGGADQATSTLATLGTSGPGEQGGNHGWPDVVSAGSCTAQKNVECQSVQSYSSAPTYVSQERAPPSVVRNSHYGQQSDEGAFVGFPSCSDLGEDETLPPYQPSST